MLSETGRLARVLVKHAREAFVGTATIAAQWQALRFASPPDFRRAVAEYDRFLGALEAAGAAIEFLPRDDETTLDSIYVRDASIVAPRGAILCRMGKPQRATEPAAHERALRALGCPIAGRIEHPGTLEGGDTVWLDDATLVVGQGYRTNAAGIAQLIRLVGDGVEVIKVELPHWRGPGDVMHLMSLVSPVDRDLAVVYSPLLPVPFRSWLLDRGFRLVEVPDAEFDTMGVNVLALEPRRCLMLAGNPRTRRALERAGAQVIEYEGAEISLKGGGGPTCLTRPLVRE
jgi:N-dimethylarginine dimethylaminohydrolase